MQAKNAIDFDEIALMDALDADNTTKQTSAAAAADDSNGMNWNASKVAICCICALSLPRILLNSKKLLSIGHKNGTELLSCIIFIMSEILFGLPSSSRLHP